MSLESCPTCGYALSLVGRCRHCTASYTKATPAEWVGAQNVSKVIAVLVLLGSVAYLLFFRH